MAAGAEAGRDGGISCDRASEGRTATVRRVLPRPWGLIPAAGSISCFCTLTAFIGEAWWLFELTTLFRLQYALALAVFAALLAIPRQWKWVATFAVFAAINLGVVLPMYFGGPPPAGASDQLLRVVSINVNTDNQRFEAVRGFLKEVSPDAVLLMEVNDRWLGELAEVRQSHPHFLLESQDDHFGIALFSWQPLLDPQFVQLASTGVNAISATVEFGTNRVLLLGIQTLPLVSRGYAHARNEQLAEAASLVRRSSGPDMLLGDLNTSPWSPYYRKLIAESKLKNTAQGRG